tara:strand:- start:48618 stop:49784 length:1167 start_codon:yes stop_codon:yes gene_type:complete
VETVLVLDAQQRSALAVTRSLGSRGIRVITADTVAETLAGASRYSAESEVYASPSDPDAFLASINALIKKHSIDVLYPVTEISLYTLLARRDELADTRLPLAPFSTIKQLANKAELVALCNGLGVAAPQSVQYFSAAAAIDDVRKFAYPAIIKPALSRIQIDGQWVNAAVRHAADAEAATAILKNEPALQQHPFMVQQCIEGHGAGVFLLYDHGECIAHFTHRRVRERPPSGGVSVLSESVATDPALLAQSKRILDAVNWHGVAMVEYKVAADGTPYIMEVNTRFWGSLQLAIDSGVDFPFLLHEATMGRKTRGPEKYRTGNRLRWLMGDFDRLYLVLRGQNSSRQKISETLQFLKILQPGTRYEVNRGGDLQPFWRELKLYWKALRG